MDFLEPSPFWPEFIKRWNKSGANPPAEFSLPSKFFDEMRAFIAELPTVSGELNPMFTGCYDSRERVKKLCRESQHAAAEAERLASVAASSGWMNWPAATLDSAWKNILKNDFHDVLCGTGTDPVYLNTLARYGDALEDIASVSGDAVAAIASRANTSSQPGEPVLIVNSLAFARRELVTVPVPENAAAFEWEAAAPGGEKTPCQLTDGGLIFIADLPPMGYAVYHITKKKAAAKKKAATPDAAAGPFKIDGLVFENDIMRAALDPRTGALFSLIDKRTGRETLDTSQSFSNELLAEEDIGNLWSVYKTGREWRAARYPVRIRFIETGPVRATAEITGAHKGMNRRQLVSLTAGSPRVDFHTHIDFSGRDLRVRALFGLKSSGGCVCETPFHATARGDGHHCAENWVDIPAAEGAGAALLNRGIPGCEASGNCASLALMRSISVLPPALPGYLLKNLPALLDTLAKTARLALGSHGMGMAEWSTHPFHLLTLREWASGGGDPDASGGNPLAADHLLPYVNFGKESLAWERGTHDFHYALLPHAGDWRAANLTAEGLAVNTPPRVLQAARSKGSLPAAHSFFDLGRDAAATLVTIKQSLAGGAFTARVYDSGGAGADVRIRAWAPIAKCEKTDMMEKNIIAPVKVSSGIARDKLAPWEIATYRFTLKSPVEKKGK